MDNPIIFQILLALVVLFFIFLTYMNTKTWRWLHVTMTFLVFVAVIPFGVYAAMTMKTRLAWIGTVDKLEKDLDKTSKDVDLVIYGEQSDVEKKGESIVGLQGDLSRTILDRGRVWRGLSGNVAGNGVNIVMVPPVDPAAPAATPPGKHNIETKTVLFAFKEGLTADGKPQMFYVGEFRVTSAAEAAITIEPQLPLTGDQVGMAGDANSTWTLYEVCPIDGHQWFAGLDETQLTNLIPQAATGLPPQQYQKFIAQFLKDGKPADEVNDPPENIWMEVKFKQPHSITVDAPAVASVDTDPFDTEGRAQLDRLRRAEPGAAEAGKSEFVPGETAVFDRQTAEALIAGGIAEKVQPIFRRRLVDFEMKFHAINERLVELGDQTRGLTADIASIQAVKTQADQQAMLLEDHTAKLSDDREKVRFELAELETYGKALAARLSDVRGELSQLYRSNKALNAEMAVLNTELTEQIDRRTREATAMNR